MEWPEDFPDDHAFVELLVPGGSSDLDLELLKDTEEKLNLNAISIEQQLKELQDKMGDCQAGERPPSPSECLQWFKLRISTAKAVATGHQELMDFFRALKHYLGSEEEEKEEVTLQLLLNLSFQCGVCFPCTPSSSSSAPPTASSIHLVHTVRDDSSLEIQEAWDGIRLQLRRYLLKRLSSCSPELPGLRQVSTLSIQEQAHCLQQLSFLYSESEALRYHQDAKRQHVLGILRSSLSTSPGNETGFDRLAKSFSCAVPVLMQTLTEELQVLSRLAEPPTILGFLNAAYLNTVAQELASQMEKECETAQRDNTALSTKIKKYSAKSRATVAPMELPMKSRSFSLTSHQLRALTQLACTLLRFESELREKVTNMTFINCTGDVPRIKGILKKRKEDPDMTSEGNKPAAETLHTSETQVLVFDWRSAFLRLVPQMEHCIRVVLDDVCAKNLQQEEALHSSGHPSVTLSPIINGASNTHLKEDSFYGYPERETPKMIAKFCGTIMAEVDVLLPLAVACKDSSLLGVRSSFVEACGRTAFAILGRLQDRALEVPSSAPLKNLPALLATCIYVCQRLEHYNARLKHSNPSAPKTPLTLLPIQKYQETVEAMKEQLTSYCVQVCSICILQDAESHRWADPKPLYEGERCSFSVQMWFYFLCGLRSDLWAVLPAELAKEVLGQVLSETLQLLVQRYARVRASYKRQPQVRCDITALLLYVDHLMWSLCGSPEELVHPKPSSASNIIAGGSAWPYQIHSLCDQLLTILIIVTAPLSLLYRTFMINAAKESTPQQCGSPVVHWRNAINPDLFTEQAIRDGLVGQTALACQLRLLTSDPGYSPKLVLRMLLYRECHLPRILLEDSYLCQENDSTGDNKTRDDFIVALFNVFSCLNNVPMALTQALQPYLEGANVWEHLYNLADSSRAVPAVISCVRTVVAKSTNSILVHLVSMMLGWQATEQTPEALFKHNVPESVLSKIPKKWNYTPLDAGGKDDVSKTVMTLAIEALSFIFTNLPMAVASLPLTIRFLFHVAEKHLSQYTRQLRLVGLLLWALLDCMIQGLEDTNTLEKIGGLVLDRGAKDRLSLLAECLQAAIGIQQKGVPKPTVLKVLQVLEEKRPKWTHIQLQKARKLCSDSVFEQEKERGVAAAELTEQKIGLMLLEVCHKAGGSNYLRQIYHIIQGNEELLMTKLSGNTDLSNDPSRLVNFNLGSETNVKPVCFNPLWDFDHIGKKKLDQSAVVEWAWDWPRLLPAYQGMSQVTFKSLLANRWEMQEDAELEDGEKAMVEELQKAFFVCCCSLEQQDPPETDEAPADQQNEGEPQPSDKNVAQ